jgi:hypothetical protein
MNTMQQEFDAVVTHLYTQGKPATDRNSRGVGPGCYYRINGLSCAVGCRIPDEIYNPQMDQEAGDGGTGVHALLRRFGYLLPSELSVYVGMFEQLQYVHDTPSNCGADGNFDLAKLERNLSNVATKFGLTLTIPQ